MSTFLFCYRPNPDEFMDESTKISFKSKVLAICQHLYPTPSSGQSMVIIVFILSILQRSLHPINMEKSHYCLRCRRVSFFNLVRTVVTYWYRNG